ncbi:LuxR C-terminal-related transcriptional regulator [Phenylobacterium sp.]|jgi:DNA-binding CsgD family transcriptional regulator/catechol 2,3-dioxygenase-like lactoylglutathione lyase family enzyme|uniref:LuxR C-terminal-related transcriptional regulator n=1 Tax=Phenylobacterium sp. TaxID=1871053 RepID=UPI002F92E477
MANNRRGRPPHPDVLTPAEWGVVEAVRHGMSNAQIARRRGVSLDAVKQHVASARGKVGADSRAELTGWTGVRSDSLLAGRNTDMDAQLQLGPIGQIARSVADIAAAQRWYGEVLGLEHLYTFGKLAFFDCGGVRLYLQEGDGPAESILYFRVPDIHAAHAALQKRGVAFSGAPHMIHRHADGMEEWMAFFADNEGRPLAIMAQVAATEAAGR